MGLNSGNMLYSDNIFYHYNKF
uniref:Uncharacterized protein n=1 Tax=Arundo donax TaxID=35708 RepID=A0A0A9GR87_ARUDO